MGEAGEGLRRSLRGDIHHYWCELMFLISLLSVHTDINRGHLFRFSTHLVDVDKSKRCRTHTASSTTISSHPPLLLPPDMVDKLRTLLYSLAGRKLYILHD